MISGTVKLGDKERFDKEQIGVMELFTDYQTFYTINLLLDKELLPIFKMPKLGLVNTRLCKLAKKGALEIFMTNFGVLH